MSLPEIAVATLGGTLSLQRGRPGAGELPPSGGEILLAHLPELAQLAQIQVDSLSLLPSASLDIDQLLRVLGWANHQIEQGAQGIVITQGTDTLEETATLLDYLWPHPEPLVLTGAMRPAGQAGADGPANLLDACRVAADSHSRGRGALVVMNARLHAAGQVRKTDALALDAFCSPSSGPAGLIIEERVHYLHGAPARRVLPRPQRTTHKVALLEASLSADTALLEQVLALDYAGLVVAGFGAGHVSASWSDALASIATHIPVIVASRTGAGATARSTYGFAGGEMDLARKGVHLAGLLCPRKARLLLWLLIGCGRQHELPAWLQP